MSTSAHHRLFRRCARAGLSFAHVVEVGVFDWEFAHVRPFLETGCRTTLIEAHPEFCANIRRELPTNADVKLVECAVADIDGPVVLCRRGSSTFAKSLPASPTIVNEGYAPVASDEITVRGQRFSAIDDGTIDLLCVDIEGGEWFVLKHLRSRPQVIALETHGRRYRNPFLPQINAWMAGNNYLCWFRDKTDSVFARRDVFTPTAWDRILTLLPPRWVVNLKLAG